MHFEGAQSQTPKCMISLRFKRGFGGVFAPLLNGMPRPPEMGRVRIFFFVGPAGQERVRIFFVGPAGQGLVRSFFAAPAGRERVRIFFAAPAGTGRVRIFFAAGAGQRTC